jgi:hypothetical protein
MDDRPWHMNRKPTIARKSESTSPWALSRDDKTVTFVDVGNRGVVALTRAEMCVLACEYDHI